MGSLHALVDFRKMLPLLFFLLWGIPYCLSGESCSISQGATTITAFCQAGCCSDSCCTESEEEGISTTAIVLSVLIAVIVLLIIIVLIVISYRKKKPKCCYRTKEEEEDKEKLDDEATDALTDKEKDKKKKDTSVDESCSSGYSSSQSVHSVNNTKKPPVARPASPFQAGGSPILPPMSIPRSTAPPPAGLSFANPAFDKSEDKTEILNMKKNKTQAPKTVTFKNRIDSPRGSINSISSEDKIRTHYPPILPPLNRGENTPSDLFSTEKTKTPSPTEKPVTGSGHNKRHRMSYPTENKIGFLGDDTNSKTKTGSPSSLSPNSKSPQSILTSPDVARLSRRSPSRRSDPNVILKGKFFGEDFDAKSKPSPLSSPTTAIISPLASDSILSSSQATPLSKTTSPRRRDPNYNVKESAYVPTIVLAADSKDSVNSVEIEDKDGNNKSRTNSFSSPYLATPYTIKKNRRILGSTSISDPFSQSGNSSPQSTELSNGRIEHSNRYGESSNASNNNSIFVSSFMRQKSSSYMGDSPV